MSLFHRSFFLVSLLLLCHQCIAGRVVYEALVGVGVPKDDRFQVISEYDTDSFLFDPNYIGIHRTNDLVIIQITWNEGRNPEQKKGALQTDC